LNPTVGARAPYFGGSGALVNARVRQEMYRLYISNSIPVYLDKTGRKLLDEGRYHFRQLNLHKLSIIQDGKDVLLFPWGSDKQIFTLVLRFQHQGQKSYSDGVAIRLEQAIISYIQRILEEFQSIPIDPVAILEQLKTTANLVTEKHDIYVPTELLHLEFVARYFE
jgi:hypothetical protein